MEILLVIAIILIALTWMYSRQMSQLQGVESYADYISAQPTSQGPDGAGDGIGPELAQFGQGLPLSDFLTPKERMGVSNYDAEGCAGVDKARQLELGGQYVQRTNNYRHTYPDNCSSPLSDFVGSIYKPVDAVGETVPCDGLC
jgi:hypothetical protein